MRVLCAPPRASPICDKVNPTRYCEAGNTRQRKGPSPTVRFMVPEMSKLGADIRAPRPGEEAGPLNLARETLRSPVASLSSMGISIPLHPTTRGVPAPRPRRKGVPALSTPDGGRSCPLDPRPTLRGLDARSAEPCSSDTSSVGKFRFPDTPRRKAFPLSTPDQQSACWMRADICGRRHAPWVSPP